MLDRRIDVEVAIRVRKQLLDALIIQSWIQFHNTKELKQLEWSSGYINYYLSALMKEMWEEASALGVEYVKMDIHNNPLSVATYEHFVLKKTYEIDYGGQGGKIAQHENTQVRLRLCVISNMFTDADDRFALEAVERHYGEEGVFMSDYYDSNNEGSYRVYVWISKKDLEKMTYVDLDIHGGK